MSREPVSRAFLYTPLRLMLAAALSAVLAGAADPPSARWTVEQMESFLSSAEIVDSRPVSEGVTHTVRATLREGGVTHDAQIQRVDESRASHATAKGWELNFRDYWGYNVAAYRLGRILHLRVPVSVRREIDGELAAVTWWLDDVLMNEKTRFRSNLKPPDVTAWNRQMYVVRVFDQLIRNTDRNLANLVITRDWNIWMIDHTRAFRLHRELENPKQLVMCERGLLDALRKLDYETLASELGEYLTGDEIDALLARRDRMVEHFDALIAQGKDVLFDNPQP